MMPNLTLEQIAERDILVFGEEKDWSKSPGGIYRFEGIDPDTAWELINKGYLDPEDRQNYSPEAKALVDWGMAHHGLGVYTTFGGYVVSPDREDCRVSIDSISCEWHMVSPPRAMVILFSFIKHFRDADEFEFDSTSGSAWWN